METLDSEMHLRQTDAFVATNPVSVRFIRKERLDDGAGGFTLGPPRTLLTQKMRMIPVSEVSRTTADGQQVLVVNALVGTPPIDVQEGDTFVLDGTPFQVVSVNQIPEWRVSAEIVEESDGS